MKSTTQLQSVPSAKEPGYTAQFQASIGAYLQEQHPIVRGLHWLLQALAFLCLALAIILFSVALYYTFVWAFTGELTRLADVWVNFGLSMSFLVFPWGLDAMLLRVFPTVIFPIAWYHSSKPIRYITGIGAFFAGFGITCAGAPGAVHFFDLASQAIQNLF
jgi:hypothetical protein